MHKKYQRRSLYGRCNFKQISVNGLENFKGLWLKDLSTFSNRLPDTETHGRMALYCFPWFVSTFWFIALAISLDIGLLPREYHILVYCHREYYHILVYHHEDAGGVGFTRTREKWQCLRLYGLCCCCCCFLPECLVLLHSSCRNADKWIRIVTFLRSCLMAFVC